MTSEMPVTELETGIAELQVSDLEDEPIVPPLARRRRTKSLYGASPNCKFGPKGCIMKNQANILTIQDPGSQRLKWYKPPLSVLIIKKILDETLINPFVELTLWLAKERSMVVYVESKVCEDPVLQNHCYFKEVSRSVCTFKEGQDDLTDKIDLIITIGGDGTLLYASSLFQESVPPIMAFHFGSLGFLSHFDITCYKEQIGHVLKGNVPLSLRTRLKCSLTKEDSRIEETSSSIKHVENSIKHIESKQHILVLNEVVVDRGPSAYICNIDLYIEHRYVTSVQGDGLIIASPTGSTAYATAAGASMVHPNVPAIVIAPICAHSLSFRPIIVPAGVEIKIKLNKDTRNSAWISFDGRNRTELACGDTLRISTSIYPIPSICFIDQMGDWFESLASCLHWNARKPQKPLRQVPSADSVDWNSNESNGDNGN